MSKKGIIAVSVLLVLLTLCILSAANAKYAKEEAASLANEVELLKNDNIQLQAENDELHGIIASIQQEGEEPAEVSGLEQPELDKPADAIFETNPIDSYFIEMAHQIVPTTTAEMVEYGLINCAAWEAEMVNCYEILKSKTKDEYVRKCIDDDKNSYIEYIKNNAELDIYFTASGAFIFEEENVFVGSISSVLRVSAWEDGYRKKTLELFHRLYELGITPKFIFSEEDYNKQIQEKFPERWKEVFE